MAAGCPAAVGGPGLAKSFRSALTAGSSVTDKVPDKVNVTYGEMQGMPAVFISDDDMISLAKPFELTLIGKFSVDRPPIADIRRFVVRMKFFGFVNVDNHDPRNVVFRFRDERDYMRFFARRVYSVLGIQMRVTKWSPFYDVSEELPIVPIWVSFPGLRYQLYHLKTLMDIAAVFGKPLCVDSNTVAQGSMTKARVLVEVDVSIAHPKWVWLGSKEKGALQPVNLENLPLFCSCCRKLGHEDNDCVARGKVVFEGGPPSSAPVLQWVPKVSGMEPGSDGTHRRVADRTPSGEGNHPGPPPPVVNCSNFTDVAQKFQEGESSRPLKDILPNQESPLSPSTILKSNPPSPSADVVCAGGSGELEVELEVPPHTLSQLNQVQGPSGTLVVSAPCLDSDVGEPGELPRALSLPPPPHPAGTYWWVGWAYGVFSC